MAIPALTRAYFTRGNAPISSVTSALNIARSCTWALKAHLCNNITTGTTGGTRQATSIWTVLGSSNGTTGALDGVDRWGTTFNGAALVYNSTGSNHSWIVLRNSTLGYDICIDLETTNVDSINVIATKSTTPFAGGSVNTRPQTAGNAEEFTIHNSSTPTGSALTWLSDLNIGGTVYSTFTTADNGEFWIAFHRVGSGLFSAFVGLWKAVGGRTNDTRNMWFFRGSGASSRGSPSSSNGYVLARRSYNGNYVNAGGMIVPQFGATAYQGVTGTDIETGDYMLIPTYLMQLSDNLLSSAPIWCGSFPDIFLTGSATVGGSYPLTGTQERTIVGDFNIPDNTVNPIL